MFSHAQRIRTIVAASALVLAAGACGGDQSATPSTTTQDRDVSIPPAAPDGADAPTEAGVTRPEAGTLPDPVVGELPAGKGKAVLLPPTIDLAGVGYVESEHSLSGTAKRYRSSTPLATSGDWKTEAVDPTPFTTRVIVRRPVDPAAFDGTVVVEWFNVSGGLEAAPDWTYLHREIVRSGAVWVGVSAQKVGIDGSDGGLVSGLSLKASDPERYGALVHPGDDYSYDIFTQAASAIWFQSDVVLDGLDPTRVIATGESQSAFRITSYVNAVAPQSDAFSGYLVHSRGKAAAPLIVGDDAQIPPDATVVRDDVGAPVLTFLSETDLAPSLLGAIAARQDDTDGHRTWEVAGTAHADAYLLGVGDQDVGDGEADLQMFAELQNPRSSIYFGVITCDRPINAGHHGYALRAAMRSLVDWIDTGKAPVERPRLEFDEATGDFRRDEFGNAIGGVRSPAVDAPLAALSGLGQDGGRFCALFGTTTPMSAERLVAKYGTLDGYRQAWLAAVADAEEAGSMLPEEASTLRSVADRLTIMGLS